MEREIKFRGICKNTNKWVYGYLINSNIGFMIINDFTSVDAKYIHKNKICFQSDGIEVIREYIGQYTGLHDMNGLEIYEGDIICNDKYQTLEWRGVVKFSHGVFGVEWISNQKNQSMVGSWGQKHNLRKLDDGIIERIVILGNIYENS